MSQRDSLLVALVYALSAAAFAYPLAPLFVVLAAAAGAAGGALVAPRLLELPLRALPKFVAWLLALGAAVGLRALVVGSDLFASLLGPALALLLGDALLFGAGALVVVAGLRMAATRYRLLVGLEVVVVGASFAALLFDHREGAINRPFELADPILALGLDPTLLFLGVGALTAFIVLLLTMRERRLDRVLLHIAVAIALLALLLFTTRYVGLPSHAATTLGEMKNNETPSGGGSSTSPNPNSQAPEAVVVFHAEYPAPTGVYYFRQLALSQFNGNRLVAATRAGVDLDLPQGFPSEPTEVEAPPPSGVGRQLVDTTVALLADNPRPFGLESVVELAPERNPDPSRFRRVYRVTSSALTADPYALLSAGAGDPAWSDEVRAHYTARPSDPRYAALAQKIIDEELPEDMRAEPYAQAYAITRWLGREGTYSIKRRAPSEGDPAAAFLFGDKVGYCVHFAHAATYLMRSLGLPSRVATGYAVEEAARQGGSSLVIAGNRSHAWPEVYLDDYGWVVTDVYPERSLDPPPPPPDPELQRILGEMARGQQDNPVTEQAREALLDTVASGARSLGWLAALLGALAVALGYAVKLWRRLAPSFARPASWPRVAYRAQLDRLAEVSLRRRHGESREAFAARVAELNPSFTHLTELHVAAAFGSASVSARTPAVRASLELRSELARALPLWRRVLGALNPYSWLLSR